MILAMTMMAVVPVMLPIILIVLVFGTRRA
jgi:hypothetical protein